MQEKELIIQRLRTSFNFKDTQSRSVPKILTTMRSSSKARKSSPSHWVAEIWCDTVSANQGARFFRGIPHCRNMGFGPRTASQAPPPQIGFFDVSDDLKQFFFSSVKNFLDLEKFSFFFLLSGG